MKTITALLIASLGSLPLYSQQLLIQHHLQAPAAWMPDSRQYEWMDMDADGDPDLFTKDVSSSSALIYVNEQGNVQLIPHVVESDKEVRNQLLADWNADGLPDIILEQTGNGQLFVRFNLGGLNFGPSQDMGSTGNLTYMKPKDLNGDGFPELYAESDNWVHNSTTFFEFFQNNSGAPVFTYQYQFTNQQGFTYEFADVDGDGIPEHISAALFDPVQSNQSRLYIRRNTGNYQYELIDSIDIGTMSQYGLFVSDMDNDGRSEFIYQTSQYNWRAVRRQGQGQFANTLIGQTGAFDQPANVLFVYDIDGNGFQDIRINNDYYWNSGFQFTKTTQNLPYFKLVDTDANGSPEAWWVAKPAYLYKAAYNGSGAFETPQLLVQAWPADDYITAMDVENDGDMDFLYFNYDSDYLILSRNNNGIYSESIVYYDFIFPREFVQLDLNGDGFKDFITGRVLFQNDGLGNFSPVLTTPGTKVMAAGDLNNDGLDDLLVYDNINSQHLTSLYLNTGGGFAPTGQPVVSGAFPDNLFYTLGDIDNDGWMDVFVWRDYSFFVFKNLQGQGLEEVRRGFGLFAGLEDMNGDGFQDIVSVDLPDDPFNPSPYGAWLWPNDGNGGFGLPILLHQLQHSNYLVYAYLFDVNADGLKDLLISNNSPSGFGIMINEGFQFGPINDQGSNSLYFPFVIHTFEFDFDADGDLDISFITRELADAERFSYWENISDSPYRIFGRVFFDANANGLFDPGEHPAEGVKLGIENPASFAVSDSLGGFSIPTGAAAGDFGVQVFNAPQAIFETTTTSPAAAQLSAAQPTDTVLIGIRIADSPRASLDQSLSAHRCSEPGRLWLPFTPYLNGPASGELRLTFPAGLSWQGMDSLSGATVQGNDIIWPLSNLPTLSAQTPWVDFLMPDFQSAGDTLLFFAVLQLHTGLDTILVRDTFLSIVTCAYDPNDKLIANAEQFLAGREYFTLTAPDRLEYVIRFQNTGNDTARQVVILDNLNANFDYGSLQFLSASQPCRVNMDMHGLLRVEFPDIYLPDSAVNFTGSMGFVKFSISLRPDPPRAVPIPNQARILFDLNPPVLTNVVRFRIVDCAYFTTWSGVPDINCQGDSVLLSVPDFSLEQSYAWTNDGAFLSDADTALVVIQNATHLINLQVKNSLCTADTSFLIYSSGQYPDLQLNIPGDSVAICESTTLEISANMNAEWYQNDSLVQYNGTQYTASTTQVLRIKTNIPGQVCQAEKSIAVTVADMPEAGMLIEQGAQSYPLQRCGGSPITLSTGLSGGVIQWSLYNNLTGSQHLTNSPSLSLLLDTIPNAFVTVQLDTLNCTLQDVRTLWLIPAGPAELLGDPIFCDLAPAPPLAVAIGQSYIYADSVLVYKNGQLIQTYYNALEVSVPAEAGIPYYFEIFADCRRDTVEVNYRHLSEFDVHIVPGSDTLFTSHGGVGVWFYAPSPGTEFSFIPDAQLFVAHPPTGYYFMYYYQGLCEGISDTLYYENTGVYDLDSNFHIGLYPNPTYGLFTLELPYPAPPNLRYRLLDLTSRRVLEGAVQTGSTREMIDAGEVPGGMYLLQVVQEGRVLGAEKLIRQ